MSDLKWILIEARLDEQQSNPGFIGDCTIIVYDDSEIVRNEKPVVVVEEEVDELEGADDVEL